MKQFLVRCGEAENIVEAADATEASAKFFTTFDDCDMEDVPDANFVYTSVIEVVGDELFFKTEDAIKRAGRDGESYRQEHSSVIHDGGYPHHVPAGSVQP